MKETEERFINYGYRLLLPQFTASTKFGSLEKYLGLESRQWFSIVSQIMAKYSHFFKAPGNLGQCPVMGPGAGQVVCEYLEPSIALRQPHYPGDMRYVPTFTMLPHSLNMKLNDDEQKMGFFSQINTLYCRAL